MKLAAAIRRSRIRHLRRQLQRSEHRLRELRLEVKAEALFARCLEGHIEDGTDYDYTNVVLRWCRS